MFSLEELPWSWSLFTAVKTPAKTIPLNAIFFLFYLFFQTGSQIAQVDPQLPRFFIFLNLIPKYQDYSYVTLQMTVFCYFESSINALYSFICGVYILYNYFICIFMNYCVHVCM